MAAKTMPPVPRWETVEPRYRTIEQHAERRRQAEATYLDATRELAKAIRRAHKRGRNVSELARTAGVNRRTVYRFLGHDL